jgi:hypothetical protein
MAVPRVVMQKLPFSDSNRVFPVEDDEIHGFQRIYQAKINFNPQEPFSPPAAPPCPDAS